MDRGERTEGRGTVKMKPIKERIEAAYEHGISYWALMRAVFPPEAYPRAWRCAVQGGPPGCAMAFGSALRRGGFVEDTQRNVWRR